VALSRQPIRAVIFDLFDTLVDLHMEELAPLEFRGVRVAATTPALYEAFSDRVPGVAFERFAEALLEVDAGYRKSRYAKGLELPTRERFATLIAEIGGGSDELVEQLVQIHMGALREHVRSIDHHPQVLADLSGLARLALCSNFSHSETALRVLGDTGLRRHLEVIVVSDARGFRKPRPEIFLQVLDGLGVCPEEALHVGDNLSADVGGAAAVGIRTAWLTRRVSDPDGRLRAYDGPAPDYSLADLAELEPLLRELGA
jgi:HAD superfamily hydrolase (TIGR01493 family)